MPLLPFSRDQAWLLPPALGDLVPDGHPARFVPAFVDGLDGPDWAEMTKDIDEEELGAPAYHPRILLSIWLYGFLTGVRYARKQEVGLPSITAGLISMRSVIIWLSLLKDGEAPVAYNTPGTIVSFIGKNVKKKEVAIRGLVLTLSKPAAAALPLILLAAKAVTLCGIPHNPQDRRFLKSGVSPLL